MTDPRAPYVVRPLGGTYWSTCATLADALRDRAAARAAGLRHVVIVDASGAEVADA